MNFLILPRAASGTNVLKRFDLSSATYHMLQERNRPRSGISPEGQHTIILSLWAVMICCVVIGSWLPAASPVMVEIGRLHVNDKVLHFCAYLALSFLPVIGCRDRRRGIVAGLSMFAVGILLEGGQQFSPGRSVELGDVLANCAGVSCGALLGVPIRSLIAVH